MTTLSLALCDKVCYNVVNVDAKGCLYMRVALRVFRILLWCAVGLTALLQALVLFSLSGTGYASTPLGLTCMLMVVGLVLFCVMKEKRYIGITVCAAAAVAFIFIAIDLYRTFPVSIEAYGPVGLDLWKTIWRHCSPALIPLLMLPVWLLEVRLDLLAQIRKAKQKAKPFRPILEENADITGDMPGKKKQQGIRVRKK